MRDDDLTECLLLALSLQMPPDNADLRQFHEYISAREWGLALGELAEIVNER